MIFMVAKLVQILLKVAAVDVRSFAAPDFHSAVAEHPDDEVRASFEASFGLILRVVSQKLSCVIALASSPSADPPPVLPANGGKVD